MVARNYLTGEKPDAVINIIDGTNIERNLYLTTQIIELGIPVIVAVNMMDLVVKSGDKIDIKALGEKLGCEVVEISAVKGTGVVKAAEKAVAAAHTKKAVERVHKFDDFVEEVIAETEDLLGNSISKEQKRFFAIKLLERDKKIQEAVSAVPDVSAQTAKLEEKFDDDIESIITNERYVYISSIIKDCVKKAKGKNALSVSDKIDKVVTNRILALPIFVAVMWLVYYLAMSTVGASATDWTNDNLFGDGFHLFGIGSSEYNEKAEEFAGAAEVVNGFIEYADAQGMDVTGIAEALDEESEDFDASTAKTALASLVGMFDSSSVAEYRVEDEETLEMLDEKAEYQDLTDAVSVYEAYDYASVDPAEYGVWICGIPVLAENGLNAIHCADWLQINH